MGNMSFFLPLGSIIAEVIRSNRFLGDEPRYEPPYDSPLEDIFAWNLAKYLKPDAKLHKQVEAATLAGTFRLDLVVEYKSEKIAFECDGKEFHGASRDEWRDAMILGDSHVNTIYRLRGSDVIYHTEDCLYVISCLEPRIFSERGLINLDTLASNSIRNSLRSKMNFDKNLAKGDRLIVLDYFSDLGCFPPQFIKMVRETRHSPKEERAHWKYLYSYALKNKGLPLDALIEKHWTEVFATIFS
jgi:very-short-patch-repair endonuclease